MKSIVFATSIVTAALGCSALSEQRLESSGTLGDIRGEAPIEKDSTQAIISGPVVVKHLETDGKGTVALYLMKDRGIDEESCPTSITEGLTPVAVLEHRQRITDLLVPDGQRICAAVSNAPSANVMWHARSTCTWGMAAAGAQVAVVLVDRKGVAREPHRSP